MPNDITGTVAKVAEKSFFESTAFTVLTKGVPALKELLPVFSILIYGVQDSKEMMELKKISSQLNQLSSELGGVAINAVYLNDIKSVKLKLEGLQSLLKSTSVIALTEDQLSELCNFLTPGLNGPHYTNYYSCISNLLSVAYAVGIEDVLKSTPQSPCKFGVQTCEAKALNNSLLSKPTPIIDYLDAHSKFAFDVATIICSVAIVANECYQFVAGNIAAIDQYFSTPKNKISKEDVLKTINNVSLKADVASTSADSFIGTKISSIVLKWGPEYLGGVAYKLVNAMIASVANQGKTFSNVGIIRKEGVITPSANRIDITNNLSHHFTEYTDTQASWNATFSNNNTVSSYFNFTGSHGGFLGMLSDLKSQFVYELISNNPSSPAYQWNKCIWQVMVKHNESKDMIFMLINKEYSNIALANNHGFLISAKPGFYRYEIDNPDEYWTFKLY